MIDPDLQKQLEAINSSLVLMNSKKSPGIWRAFFNGMFGAFGYLVGIIVVVVIVGWFLEKTGLVTPFRQEWDKFQTFMYQAENTMSAAQGQNQQGSGVPTTVTLPNGQQLKVNLPNGY